MTASRPPHATPHNAPTRDPPRSVLPQFADAVAQLASKSRSVLPPHLHAAMCSDAAAARRSLFDEEFGLPALAAKMRPHTAAAAAAALPSATASSAAAIASAQTAATGSADGDTAHALMKGAFAGLPAAQAEAASWLFSLLVGDAALPLPEGARSDLSVATATYLDPFLDGEVPPGQSEGRSAGLFRSRLAGLFAVEVPSECVLAQYVLHCVAKLNVAFGFGPYVLGVGRQPASGDEQERHLQRLGVAIIAAVERDFAPAHRKLRGLASLSAELLAALGRAHLAFLYQNQDQLNAALAAANEAGEVPGGAPEGEAAHLGVGCCCAPLKT